MNKKIRFIYLLAMLFSCHSLLEAKQKEPSNNSIYESSFSSIAQKDCQTLDSDDLGSIEECEPFAGMQVVVIEGDMKQSIVLTRDNKRYELNFRSLVPKGFILLGLDLEWLYKRQEFDNPRAMIMRLDVNEDEENIDKVTSYALVSKITEKEICLVGKVKLEKNQNKLAYKMAEEAYKMPCVPPAK